MNVTEITDKKQPVCRGGRWNELVAGNSSPASFLQSWEQGEVQKSLGHAIYRLAVSNNDDVICIAHVVVKKLLGKKKYIVIERGPILRQGYGGHSPLSKLFGEVERIAKKHNAVFLRVSPLDTIELPDFKKPRILRKLLPPHATLFTDLSYSEEELLAGMHQKTRYNINLARKKGVTVAESDIDTFYTLMQKTAERQDIKIFPKSHYQQLLDHGAYIMSAYYNETAIATALLYTFGDTTTYLHGGSDHDHRNVMAPYVLHWEAMIHAKLNGIKWYDWWGIQEMKNENRKMKNDWGGITRFKKGFGDETTTKEVIYPKTKDLVYQPFWYTMLSIGKHFKK